MAILCPLSVKFYLYFVQFEEPLADKRARLVYQSRKRGMLENGLLLGNISNTYLEIGRVYIIGALLV